MALLRAASPLKGNALNQVVSSWVVEWFSSRGKLRCGVDEALEIDYLQAGLLTSLEIVELVTELEDRFGVQFSEAEMQDPRFSTIGGIADLITAGLRQSGTNPAELDSADSNREQPDRSAKVL
jgi:acyl carrier protein